MKLKGIRTACALTKDIYEDCDFHVQIDLDPVSGELFAAALRNGGAERTIPGHTVIRVANAYRPMSMQKIKDRAAEAMETYEAHQQSERADRAFLKEVMG